MVGNENLNKKLERKNKTYKNLSRNVGEAGKKGLSISGRNSDSFLKA
ncbi:MAG: hypothetical protein M0Z25_04015 [Nitrospiraceae bacterium]|nr:hypothetical protein [Nitrospiraceae bacterium]